MNAVSALSDHIYGHSVLRDARETEYDAFLRVTRMMRDTVKDCTTREAIAAVSKNNELWTLLASDLAHSDNGLPDDVKAGLLSLAFFSLRHGHKVLAGKATSDVLIDVNMSVMKGLRNGGAR